MKPRSLVRSTIPIDKQVGA